MDRTLTRNQKRAISAGKPPVHVSVAPGCGGTEILARRFLQVAGLGRTRPDEILVLARTRSPLDSFRERVVSLCNGDRRAIYPASIHTLHSFCNRLLHENALDAGIDPRFAILSGARHRVLSSRLADEVIEAHSEDITALGLIMDDDTEPVRECILSIYTQGNATPIPAADPRVFMETFERCCMELVAPVGMSDDWPEGIIDPIKADMPAMLLAAHRMVSTPDWAVFDWKALRKLRSFRGRFRPHSGSRQLDHVLVAARTAFDGFIAACLDRQSALCAGLLGDLVREFGALYSAEKTARGFLDYDDILRTAADLLQRTPEIAHRYRDRFSLVIADSRDFSDTDWQIVRAVSCPEGLMTSSPEYTGGNGHIRLTENFRSRKGIIDFTNHLFGTVWDEEPGAVYEPLKSAGDFAASTNPCVEMLVLPRDYALMDDGTPRRHIHEAHAIVEKILKITGHVPKPVSYGDIIILLRSDYDLRTYERALEDHGIPVCAIGGHGFYDAPEIRDILNLLRAVSNPEDGTALSGVLSSPFAGIHDPATADSQQVSAFWELMDDLISMCDWASVADLLDAALSGSGFHLRILAMRGGLRRYANLRKFRESLDDLEPGIGLREYLAQADEFQLFGSREPEAIIQDPHGDVVRIMTIHQAGEVQSPVVFIADLSRRLTPEPSMSAFDPDRGLAVRPASLKGRIEMPLGYREINEVIRDKAMLQEKRLFCTAMTRAEERLILVGSSMFQGDYRSTYRETSSWMGWLEKALDLGPGSHPGHMSVGDCRLWLEFVEPKFTKPDDGTESTPAERFDREFREGLRIESAPDHAIARDALDRCLRSEPPAPRRISRMSVSQALDYIECPAHYRWKHIIGIPEQSADPPDDPVEMEFSAADLGHVVHDLLSRIDFSTDIPPQIDRLVSSVSNQALRTEAEPLIRRFAESRWCAELQASDEILCEVPFEYVIAGKVFAGRIDLMYRSSDGWVVLDYKTGRAEDRERYELQVGVYAHAVHTLIGEMPVRSALVLLSLGDEWVQDTSDGSAAQSASERIGAVISAVDASRFECIPGHYCAWCSGSSLCTKE